MIIERVESWLLDTAFPFWSEQGLDRQGPGFVEHLTLAGVPADVTFKRVRVQARQVYCFCRAAELGWSGDGVDTARHGVELLIDKAWAGAERGWASTLTRAGEPLDTIPDLYDIAFVLFALGFWHRVTGDPRVSDLAGQTLDFLGRHMRHPSGEGYLHRAGGRAPFLQNPHMHLTEAMIVLRDTTGQARFADEAERLVDLCLTRFCDVEKGTLAETFDRHWSRHGLPHSVLLEPGHHYEWVWLLHSFMKPGEERSDVHRTMRRLFDFAVAHGQNPHTNLVVEAVRPDGTAIKRDQRLWPQAERLKAWLAMFERDGIDPRGAVAQGVEQLFTHYLATQPVGTWIECRDHDMKPKADKIPASSFYHIVLAFAEVLRFRHLFAPKPS
ncbi:AGE family epimerase/isomerase [Lichenifustis flavocetrariae]|uniref:AGE family epimerase/isomerase n=1 Tax=Lichenifustis flavocetrariae TaxID=2949735 RepID=A0AA41YVJ3_9HYPH|nr:AGE family epimerase/isomerase [Lichenifustis flavocetrariae]MCW6509389.1 AGE family epimerase/isomerase [Lichenifustis flavocetrariae]